MAHCESGPARTVRATLAGILALVCLGLAGPDRVLATTRVLESDGRHIVFELTPQGVRTETVPGPNGGWVRVSMDEAGLTEEVGLPQLPRGGLGMAIPFGTTPRLRVRSADWSPPLSGAIVPAAERHGVREPFGPSKVEEAAPVESARYRARAEYPDEPFSLSPVRRVRGVRMVDVIWHGAVSETFARRHRVLRSAVLEVTFEPTAVRPAPGDRRPSGAVRLESRPERLGRHWERTVRGATLNPESALRWAARALGDGESVGDAPWGGGTQWKVRTDDTGLTEITYASLAAADFPSGVPVEQVSLYQRDFRLDFVDDATRAAADLFHRREIPIDLRDRNDDGVFNAGDGIVFWARSVRDQYMTSGYEYEDRHDVRNAYWVRVDASGSAARMPLVRSGGSLSGAPGDTLASTPMSVFREEDLRYYDHPPDLGRSGPGNPNSAFETEIYFWNNAQNFVNEGQGFHREDSFDVFDPVANRAATLRAQVSGGGQEHGNFTNRITFTVNGDSVIDRTFYNSEIAQPDSQMNVGTIAANTLVHGAAQPNAGGPNVLAFRGWTFKGRTAEYNPNTLFFFDWYEVTYDRELKAIDDVLVLTTERHFDGSPATTNAIVRARALTGSNLRLYDVTGAGADSVTRLGVDPGQVVPAGNRFQLLFDHDHAASGGEPRKFAVALDGAVPEVQGEDVLAVAAPTLLAGGSGAQWVAVAADDLVDGTMELAAHRSAKYSTQVAGVSEIYDVFGGGRVHPDAIRAYSAYAYHRWRNPIEFLLLVGDASEDHRGINPDAMPDLVPSHSLFASYAGELEDSDQYYAEVTRDAPGDPFDDLADLYVGRLAVNTSAELAWNVLRIREYEERVVNADPLWRHRVLLQADDAFSGDLNATITAGYYWHENERNFEGKSEEYAGLLASHPSSDLRPVPIYVSTASHPCPDGCYTDPDAECEAELGRDCGVWYRCRDTEPGDLFLCVRTRVRPLVLSRTLDELSQGALIWNFQGHANKYQLTHEEVFSDNKISSFRDVEAIDNRGMPFIFFGWACHLAEFDRADEERNEDCIAEKLMNHRAPGVDDNPGGAVACFASSGFEFLAANLDFNEILFESLFYPERSSSPSVLPAGATLPVDGEGGVYGWTLGESTTRSRLRYQQRYPAGGTSRQAAQRYVLLGDPALEPHVGPPPLSVEVDGTAVEDPSDVFFVEASAPHEGPYEIRVSAEDARGIASFSIRNSVSGDVEQNGDLTEEVNDDGVRTAVVAVHHAEVGAADDYDLEFRVEDSAGAISRFTLRVQPQIPIDFFYEPVVYPNPFRDAVELVLKPKTYVEDIEVSLYTVAGRRIQRFSMGSSDANERVLVPWDGRDENGNPVGNGTYFFRVRATRRGDSVERVVPAVLMR